MALKRTHNEMRAAGFKVTPDEFDMVMQYDVLIPSIDPVWFGTTAVGTAGQRKALVVTNLLADYPRNAVYGVASAAGSVTGGTWNVTGKDQFGAPKNEQVTIGTATGGGTVAGTQIWSQISAGTFSFNTNDDPGNGSPRLGVAIGTSATLQHWFGLPVKLQGVSDVKGINWINNGTQTTFNGGTVTSTYVSPNNGTPANAFHGSAVITITDRYLVSFASSYKQEEGNINNL